MLRWGEAYGAGRGRTGQHKRNKTRWRGWEQQGRSGRGTGSQSNANRPCFTTDTNWPFVEAEMLMTMFSYNRRVHSTGCREGGRAHGAGEATGTRITGTTQGGNAVRGAPHARHPAAHAPAA